MKSGIRKSQTSNRTAALPNARHIPATRSVEVALFEGALVSPCGRC